MGNENGRNPPAPAGPKPAPPPNPPSASPQQPAAYPERIVLRSRDVSPHWYFTAKKSDRPDIEGAPVYETPDEIVLRESPESQHPAAAGEMAELVGLLDEVRSHFTRDDDLPDDLLPRIDAALAGQQQEREL